MNVTDSTNGNLTPLDPSPELEPMPAVVNPSRRASSFAGDMLRLVTGTTFAQVLTFVTAPVLTRLFSPEAYGIGVAFASLVSIIAVVVCLRYELAIVLPESDYDAANVLAVSIVSIGLISLLTAAVSATWGEPILQWLGMPDLIPHIWLMVPSLVVTGLLMVLNAWNMRQRSYGLLARGQMTNAFVTTGLRISGGLTGFNTGGTMIVSAILGNLSAVLYWGTRTLRTASTLLRSAVRPGAMRAVTRRYMELPIYGTWAALLNTLSWQLPIFLLTSFFSPAVAGQYALGNRIISLPMSLIGDSIAKVFYQRAAEAANSGTLAALTEATFGRLVKFGLPAMLFLGIAGRDLFALLFGQEWADAGVYIQVLSVWAFFWFIASPIGSISYVLGLQRFNLFWNLANFVTRWASLWIGGMLGNPVAALGLFSVSGIVMYGFSNAFYMQKAGVPLHRSLSILHSKFIAFLPIFGIWLLLVLLDAPVWIKIGIPGLLTAGYMTYALYSEPRMRAAVETRIAWPKR